MIRNLRFAALLPLALAACGGPRATPAPPLPALPPIPAVAPAATPTEVWTREPGVVLSGPPAVILPRLGMRLVVLAAAGDSLRVQCNTCPGMPTGWLSRLRVVWAPVTPAEARAGDLADFLIAVRHAALRRDVAALRPVMSRTFIHSLSAGEGVLEAVGAWAGHRSGDLGRLPGLLDRGVTTVPGTSILAAPPEYVGVAGYPDLRAGFQRGPAGWEWIFLVRSEL